MPLPEMIQDHIAIQQWMKKQMHKELGIPASREQSLTYQQIEDFRRVGKITQEQADKLLKQYQSNG